MPGPLHDVRDTSHIAYGFMASKTLFAALDLDLFGLLATEAKTSARLDADTELVRERLEILLTDCVGLGLLVKQGDDYANTPASQTYLVRSAPSYFGDYYRFQIDRQVYPAFARLPDALRGGRAEFYRLMDDPEEALSFSRGASGSTSSQVTRSRPTGPPARTSSCCPTCSARSPRPGSTTSCACVRGADAGKSNRAPRFHGRRRRPWAGHRRPLARQCAPDRPRCRSALADFPRGAPARTRLRPGRARGSHPRHHAEPHCRQRPLARIPSTSPARACASRQHPELGYFARISWDMIP